MVFFNVFFQFTGVLCKLISTHTDCDVCIDATQFQAISSNHPAAKLANLKAEALGAIYHPTPKFYSLLWEIEKVFQKFQLSANVYELTTAELTKYNFTFPCKTHATHLVSFAVHSYLKMRMNQYIYQENNDLVKKSAEAKKTSKLLPKGVVH